MKYKMILLAGILLLGSAGWIRAEVPQKLSFAGRTFVLSKVENETKSRIIQYEFESDGYKLTILDTVEARNPVADANSWLQKCEEHDAESKSCRLEYCDNDDIVVSYATAFSSTDTFPFVRLFRFTKTKVVFTSFGTGSFSSISQYRRALCQLDI